MSTQCALASPCSCAIYDGSLCASVFGQANISVPVVNGSTAAAQIAFRDGFLSNITDQFSTVQDQNCIDYGIFLGCMALNPPCPGSAWCGPNSKDELERAVSSACTCNRPDSCIVNQNGVNTTAIDTLHSVIDMNLLSYLPSIYGNAGNSTGNMKTSVMSITLVAILFTTSLLL